MNACFTQITDESPFEGLRDRLLRFKMASLQHAKLV